MVQLPRSPRSSRSSSSLCSRASSSRTSILSDETPPTSMSGSFNNGRNDCHCELANETGHHELYLEHARSTDGLWFGPVPLSEWQDHFLPPVSVATPKVDFSSVPALNGQTAFADCVRESGLCASVFPRAAHAVHGKDHITNLHHSLDFTLLSQELEMDHDSRRTREDLLASTLAFGAITSEDFDPCAFSDGKPDTDKAASMRGRLSATVQAIAANSYRRFVYVFVLMPELARLIRFDHGGIVYSELFPWRTSSDLVDFLTRLDHMSAAERGCDTSVAPIPSDCEEVLRAKEILARCDTLPAGVNKSSVIPRDHKGQLSLIRVFDDETKSVHRVVVHRAISSAGCFTSRATRGYYGVDLDEDIVVYVKDAWRIDSSGTAPEAQTYRRLAKQNVPHLAGFYFGGDVPVNTPVSHLPSSQTAPDVISQTTHSTHDFIREHPEYERQGDVPSASLRLYVHHRLLFKRIGRPLNTFVSTRELCTALLHAMEAHGAAFEDAKVLHRDISGGNILVDKSGRGMLIDWDMCVWLENKDEAEKIGQKVGTWRFISAGLLDDIPRPRKHLLRDDLESFAHVLFYHVLRYRPTVVDELAKKEVRDDIHDVFERMIHFDDGQNATCGRAKPSFLTGNGRFPKAFFSEHVRPLALLGLIHDLLRVFAPIYTNEPSMELCCDEDEREEAAEEIAQLRKARALSEERLHSTEYLASRFRHWIYDYHNPARPQLTWSSNDGAVDQFPPPPLIDTWASSGESRSSRKRSSEHGDSLTPPAKSPRLSAAPGLSAGASARAFLL
ncbi:hypothetical protein PENSPDRAFT_599441 [Peniophora sp. CONT]|nr:hypothetical protein PENSPDRAFT_599441 [Peniophora sp. CONT]